MYRRFNEGISINPTGANLPSCCNWCDPNKKKSEITKHFVVAEEETDNWRRLGVIPNVGSGVSSLEGVSEGAYNDEGDERSI